MTKLVPILALLVTLACGRLSGKSHDEASADEAPLDLTTAFLVGCGPTKVAPPELAEGGKETFGCAVFSREDKHRVQGALALTDVLLNDAVTATLVANPDEEGVWLVFFGLDPGVFAAVTKVEAHGAYAGEPVTLRNEGLVVFDPEGLTDRDEKENTVVIPKDDDPPSVFEKLTGHLLLVTQAALQPGQDFNSLAGADYRCATDAEAVPTLAVYRWVALLADEATDAKDRVTLSGPLKAVDGTVLLEDATQLFATADLKGLLRTTKGDLATNALRVWTGSGAGGTRLAGKTCASWSSKDAAQRGNLGNPSNDKWQDDGDAACDKPQHLYCITK